MNPENVNPRVLVGFYLRLYKETGDEKYLKLAQSTIDINNYYAELMQGALKAKDKYISELWRDSEK